MLRAGGADTSTRRQDLMICCYMHVRKCAFLCLFTCTYLRQELRLSMTGAAWPINQRCSLTTNSRDGHRRDRDHRHSTDRRDRSGSRGAGTDHKHIRTGVRCTLRGRGSHKSQADSSIDLQRKQHTQGSALAPILTCSTESHTSACDPIDRFGLLERKGANFVALSFDRPTHPDWRLVIREDAILHHWHCDTRSSRCRRRQLHQGMAQTVQPRDIERGMSIHGVGQSHTW